MPHKPLHWIVNDRSGQESSVRDSPWRVEAVRLGGLMVLKKGTGEGGRRGVSTVFPLRVLMSVFWAYFVGVGTESAGGAPWQ